MIRSGLSSRAFRWASSPIDSFAANSPAWARLDEQFEQLPDDVVAIGDQDPCHTEPGTAGSGRLFCRDLRRQVLGIQHLNDSGYIPSIQNNTGNLGAVERREGDASTANTGIATYRGCSKHPCNTIA